MAFLSGFLATLFFHQGVFALFYGLGLAPAAPFNLEPTEPLGVPAVISLAFWGGVWGEVLWPLLKNRKTSLYWTGWIVLGAIGPTAVAFLVVFPLKGISVKLFMIPAGLLLNAAWGLGTGVFLKLFKRRKGQSKS